MTREIPLRLQHKKFLHKIQEKQENWLWWDARLEWRNFNFQAQRISNAALLFYANKVNANFCLQLKI